MLHGFLSRMSIRDTRRLFKRKVDSSLFCSQSPTLNIRERGLVFASNLSSMSIFFRRERESEDMLFFYSPLVNMGERWVSVGVVF